MIFYQWKKLFFLFAGLILLASCASKRYILQSPFDESQVPPSPDYSNENSWASLPDKKDPADSVPVKSFHDNQATADIDVFFIHPTIYTYKPTTKYKWNGDVNDEHLNHK